MKQDIEIFILGILKDNQGETYSVYATLEEAEQDLDFIDLDINLGERLKITKHKITQEGKILKVFTQGE